MPPTTSNRAPTRKNPGSAATERRRVAGPSEQLSAAAPIADSELASLFAPLAFFELLILAVSGGADSVALMQLASRWSANAPKSRARIVVATVDHGLRAQSRDESDWVGVEARKLGFMHELLVWEGAKPKTGIQDAARQARYALLVDLAWRRSAGEARAAIVTAHTQEDQAETFLMRLARGSGLDGLTGMSAARLLGRAGDIELLRPLLEISKDRLRATLQARHLPWLEDPSNESDRFERVRVRKASDDLAALGLTAEKIALSARRLDRARAALEAAADALSLETSLDLHHGAYASFAAYAFAAAPEELRLRLLARLIAAFGGQEEPVRLAKLESLLIRLEEATFKGATLAGAAVTRVGPDICIFREAGRDGLAQLALSPGDFAVWDYRFRVGLAPDAGSPVIVRALGGNGFAKLRRQLKDVKLPPARAAATLPAFWDGEALLAVPPLVRLSGMSAALSATWGRKTGLCSADFLGGGLTLC
jgi:tRNA(Ile)-lysidine synthase